MSLRLVHTVKEAGTEAEAMAIFADLLAMITDLRGFVAECRDKPSSMGQLTMADLAQANALPAAARTSAGTSRSAAAKQRCRSLATAGDWNCADTIFH